MLIADSINHLIRLVDEDAQLTSIAGIGNVDHEGAYGLAAAAMFDTPQSLSINSLALVYIGIIQLDGTIATVLGNGSPGFGEDGMSDVPTQLKNPENLILRTEQSLLITDGDTGVCGSLHLVVASRSPLHAAVQRAILTLGGFLISRSGIG